MNTKLLTAGVILAVLLGGVALFRPQAVREVVKFGALSGPDIASRYLVVGGLKMGFLSFPMTATSSRLCSYQNEFSATSTIEHVGAEISERGTLSQANNLTISTSTTAFGTSTTALVYDFAMGTGEFNMALAQNTSTTTGELGVATNVLEGANGNGTSNYILGPSEWINWVIATSTSGGGAFVTYPTGSCSVIIRKI